MPWAVRMLSPAPIVRLTVPARADAGSGPGFPWVATLAPVVVAVVIWQLTGMLFSLLFALLGPVVAVAGLVDGRRGRRRAARREDERRRAEASRLAERVEGAHAAERERRRSAVEVSAWTTQDGPLLVRTGTGRVASPVELAGDDDADEVMGPVRDLVRRGLVAPLIADARAGIGVTGPHPLAAAVARALAVELAARLSPAIATLSSPSDEAWVTGLPHATEAGEPGSYRWRLPDDQVVHVAWAGDAAGLPGGLGLQIACDGESAPHACTRAEAAGRAHDLAVRAEAAGLRPAGASLPVRVELAALLAAAGPGGEGPVRRPGSLSAPLGRDERGPVCIDLAAQGPHALVAGTTGSGKSELLVSWVLGLAHARTPDEVTFLLVDFKGGAAFGPIADLPHVLAVVSDLQPRLARRTVAGLRAELLRRERLLAETGARAIDELPPGALPRLVVVIDEYAALVGSLPELHEAIADLAARGRSLGLHLVLCTQRPAGVVRDAVLANVGLRMSLRVADRADSIAVLGVDAAARLPADPPGRAVLAVDGDVRTFQVAVASAGDAERVRTSAPEGERAVPWCDPLPADIPLDQLPEAPERGLLPFGLADLPEEQRQPVAAHDPVRHGHLLVLGAAASGVTTALAALAASARRAGREVVVLPAEPADAWTVLEGLAAGDAGDGPSPLLVADDLDLLLGRFGEEHRYEITERLAGLLRGGGARLAVAAGVRRAAGPVAGLAPLFGSRLVLRQASREDQLLAGGPGELDPAAPPGSGWWREQVVQVARPSRGRCELPPAARVELPHLRPGEHPVLALVAPRSADWAARLTATGLRVLRVGDDQVPGDGLRIADGQAAVVLGDPEAWQAEWAVLGLARRTWPMLVAGCTTGDLRALGLARGVPPPLEPDASEGWLVDGGAPIRVHVEVPPNMNRTHGSEENDASRR